MRALLVSLLLVSLAVSTFTTPARAGGAWVGFHGGPIASGSWATARGELGTRSSVNVTMVLRSSEHGSATTEMRFGHGDITLGFGEVDGFFAVTADTGIGVRVQTLSAGASQFTGIATITCASACLEGNWSGLAYAASNASIVDWGIDADGGLGQHGDGGPFFYTASDFAGSPDPQLGAAVGAVHDGKLAIPSEGDLDLTAVSFAPYGTANLTMTAPGGPATACGCLVRGGAPGRYQFQLEQAAVLAVVVIEGIELPPNVWPPS